MLSPSPHTSPSGPQVSRGEPCYPRGMSVQVLYHGNHFTIPNPSVQFHVWLLLFVREDKSTDVMSAQAPGRPYRSHSRPACLQCKRRRSRCRVESGQHMCLMCRVHDTECTFPLPKAGRKVSAGERLRARTQVPQDTPPIAPPPPPSQQVPIWNAQVAITANRTPSWQQQHIIEDKPSDATLSLEVADGDEASTLVVGPAAINDSQVLADLADYLEPLAVNRTGIRLIRTMPGEPGPVIFTTTQKRPLGMTLHESPSASKCQIIEKILDSHLDHLVNL